MLVPKRTVGFTIVELLIVVVVIAILAAISAVAYTGIQQRARTSAVKAEIHTFLKQADLFRIDGSTGRFPATDAHFKQILISSGLWDATRTINRTYVYCATSTAMTIVSYNYIETVVNGTTLHYGSSSNGLQTVVYDATIPAGSVGERVCAQTLPSSTYRQWAHNLI